MQAVAVIGYLYTGSISVDISTAAEVISLANLWQLPGVYSQKFIWVKEQLCANALSSPRLHMLQESCKTSVWLSPAIAFLHRKDSIYIHIPNRSAVLNFCPAPSLHKCTLMLAIPPAWVHPHMCKAGDIQMLSGCLQC